MWKIVILLAVAVMVVVFGFSLIDTAAGTGEVNADTVLANITNDISGYARAIEPYDWQFPHDHGPHPDFQTEWWYYTGNLADADGRRFGYQFTIFRRALTPESETSNSEWRTNQVYLVHFTVSDIEGEQFYHDERYSRGGADIAGATSDPRYRVWVEDWEVLAQNDDATTLTIRAASADVAIDFTLNQAKPPALQGDNGLSPKNDEPGNASYYYSLPLLETAGTLTIGDQQFTVTGTTWMDHEFSTSALGGDALGWDWFGLQMDDNRQLMIGQIRLVDGNREPAFGGLLIEPDGSTRYLSAEDFTIESTATWTSPHSGATYPAGWEVSINMGDAEPLDFTVTPLLADQELLADVSVYWEGAVRLSGDVTGYGYAELTGYANSMTGRF
jgi:predicted secreted hydrolase